MTGGGGAFVNVSCIGTSNTPSDWTGDYSGGKFEFESVFVMIRLTFKL